MEIRELMQKLRVYPKITVDFLRSQNSRFINIYQMVRYTKLSYRTCRDIMYRLIEDNIAERYQTYFRLTDDFMRLKEQL